MAAVSTGSGLRWLARTALLAVSRPRCRRDPPPWVPAALALGAMLSGFLIVTMSVGLPEAARWIALGMSIVVLGTGIGLCVLKVRHRRAVFAGAGWAIIALSGWTIIASAVPFETETARWIVLGSGIGYIVESVVALAAHELSPGRIVHVLEVRDANRASG